MDSTTREQADSARPVLEILSPAAIRRIHEATLEVIERVGVRFPSARALDVWEAAGASVDRSTSVVARPGDLIERALATAPATYTLAARDPARDLPLDGEHVHLATDGCGIEVLDPWTLTVRRSALQDVADIARVADALDAIAFHWVAVSAQDVPPETRSLRGGRRGLAQLHEARPDREHRHARGGRVRDRDGRGDRRRPGGAPRAPVLSLMQCTISPLAHDGGALDAALVAAEAGVPVGFMTMASCAFSGPRRWRARSSWATRR